MISIHRQTLVWLLTGLLVFGSVAGVATYQKMLEEVNEMQDFELRQIAHSMAYTSHSLPVEVQPDQQHLPEEPTFIVQIWHNGFALQYSSYPSVRLPLADKHGLSVVSDGDGQWRVYNLVSGNRTIQAAQSMEDRQATAVEMVIRMLVPFLVLIPVLAILAGVAVRQGLAPLAQVVEDIGSRDSNSLEPLNEMCVPIEIRSLVKALNELLHRLEKALSIQRQFVADAAHELRTPLTALSLQAQLVQQLPDGEERKSALHDLKMGISRASHLIQQLLDLARQEPGTAHAFCPVDLAELLRERIGELSLLAEKKNIDLRLTAEGRFWINGDCASLKILVGNLVDNAIRYTPEGGLVSVTVENREGHIILSVEDNGRGIDAGDRDRIFERFYRPLGQEEAGSGLGLAIVSEVASLHNATLQCLKSASGIGTIFTITFKA